MFSSPAAAPEDIQVISVVPIQLDAGVARTYGHLRECHQQHAVRVGKDLARSGSDLHKWEFLYLMQLPWFNWQEREFRGRE